MESILGGLSVSAIGKRFLRNDDDFADRLQHRYTTFIILIFAVVVTSKQYCGEPINCYNLESLSGNQEEYVNNICWISNTYHMELDEKTWKEPTEERTLYYYQWVPIILLFQALLFQLPHTIWQALNGKAGLDIGSVVEAAGRVQSLDDNENREKMVEYMTRQLTDYLNAEPDARHGRWAKSRQFLARNVFWLCGRSYGTYLSGSFLLTKSLYALNAVSQLAILNYFIGRDYGVFGWEVLQEHLGYRESGISERFPRVTWCKYGLRKLGEANVHRYNVQCVLPINLFNEKIFVFLWFWLVFVSVVACLSLLYWVYRCVRYQSRVTFIKVHLKRSLLLDNAERTSEVKKYSKEFVTHFLKPDGVLLLNLLEQNANQIVAVELMVALWRRFRTAYIDTGAVEDKMELLPV